MGAGYCNIIPKVKDKNGNDVDSKLFKDISELKNNDRVATKKLYYTATNKDFLDSITTEDVHFDENGEITLHSLIKVAKLDVEKQDYLKILNNKYSGVHDYVESLQKIREFNRTEHASDYLAILERVDKKGSRYKVRIVFNTPKNQDALESVIKEHETETLIIDQLNAAGVRVDFTSKDTSYKGRFSTINASKAADSMYHLITLARGKANMGETLKEEAAHFAIAALHNTVQVKRLLDLCSDPRFVEKLKLFKDSKEANEIENGLHENVYEAAGRLLANHFNGKNTFGYGGFLHRIENFVFKIFSKINPESFQAKKLEAKILAREIANDFFTGKASVDEAISHKMILNSNDYNSEVHKILLTSRRAIKILRNEIHVSNKDLYNKLMGKESIKELLDRGLDDVSDRDITTVGTLLQESITSLLEEIDSSYGSLLDLYDNPKDTDEYRDSVRRHVRVLIAYAKALDNLEFAVNLLINHNKESEFAKFAANCISEGTRNVGSSDRVKVQGFEAIKNAISTAALNEARKIGEEFLIGIAGRDAIVLEGKITFGFFKLFVEDEKLEISDLIRNVYKGNGNIDKFLGVVFRDKDIPISLIRQHTKDMNRQINKIIETKFISRMGNLEKLAKDAGYSKDFSKFLEVDDEGNVRDYFISEYKMWKYEDLRADIIRKIVEECNKEIKENPDKYITERQKSIFIKESIDKSKELKEFDDNSWVKGPNNTKHLNPDYENGIYVNEQFKLLKESAKDGSSTHVKELRLLEALLEFKRVADSFLVGPTGDPLVRPNKIPQFPLKEKNKILSFEDVKKGALHETGGDFNMGVEGCSAYASAYREADETFVRLPIHGVKSIDNPDTNVLSTLKLYAMMAARYSVLKDSYDAITTTTYALKHRGDHLSNTNGKNAALAGVHDLEKTLNKLYFGTEDTHGTKEDKKAREALHKSWRIAQGYFVAETLLLNVVSMVSNLMQSSTNYIRNSFVSDHYSSLGFFKNFIKTLPRVTRSEREKQILYHVSGVYNKRVIWEDEFTKRNTHFIGKTFNKLMSFYALGDGVGQEAVYLAMLDHYKGSDAGKSLSRVNKKIEKSGKYKDVYELLEKGSKSEVEQFFKGSSRTTSLKSIYKLGKDSFGNKTEGLTVSNNFLRNKKDTVNFMYLDRFKNKLISAIEHNELDETHLNQDFMYLVDILPNGSPFVEGLLSILDKFNISIYTDDGNFRNLNEVLVQVKNAIDEITWKEDDILKLSDSLLSEVVEAQGTYFADVKTHLQEKSLLNSAALYLGYALGSYNYNFNSGYDALKRVYVPGKVRAALFSYLNLILPTYTNNNSDDKKTYERIKKSLVTRVCIAALNTPVLNNVVRIPAVKTILKKAGYSEELIKRMCRVSNDLIFLFLAYLLQAMLFPRDHSKKARALGLSEWEQSDATKVLTPQGFSVDYWMFNLVYNSLGKPGESMLFDMMCTPVVDTEKIKKGVSALLGGKSSHLYSRMAVDPLLEEDPVKYFESVADLLYEYAEALKSGDETPLEDFENVSSDSEISNKVLKSLKLYIKNSKKEEYNIVKKDSNGKIELSFEEYCILKRLDIDNPKSRKKYDKALAKGDVYAYERFDFSRSEDIELLANQILGKTYRGMSYDKTSPEYTIAGILYYFASRNASELGGMTSPTKNFDDIGQIGFDLKECSFIIEAVDGLLNDVTSGEYNPDDENFGNKVCKRMLDKYILRKFFLETDNFGDISKPTQEELEKMNDKEKEAHRGIHFKDGFTEANKRLTFTEFFK